MSRRTEAIANSEPSEPRATTPDIDRIVVASISRWALIVAGLVIALDILLLAGYPFPEFVDAFRGPVYALFGILVLLGVASITFLGYRLVTMRVVRSRRTLWIIFLPSVTLLASIGGFALLSAPK